jgi:hypothetical protein
MLRPPWLAPGLCQEEGPSRECLVRSRFQDNFRWDLQSSYLRCPHRGWVDCRDATHGFPDSNPTDCFRKTLRQLEDWKGWKAYWRPSARYPGWVGWRGTERYQGPAGLRRSEHCRGKADFAGRERSGRSERRSGRPQAGLRSKGEVRDLQELKNTGAEDSSSNIALFCPKAIRKNP